MREPIGWMSLGKYPLCRVIYQHAHRIRLPEGTESAKRSA